MDIKSIRLLNLNMLIAENGKTAAEFAEKINISPSQLSQIRSDKYARSVSYALARYVEEKFDKPNGWMDLPHRQGRKIEPQLKTNEPQPEYLNDVLPFDSFSELPQDKYLPVPRYDVHVSAGNGNTLVWNEIKKEDPNAFRASFFEQNGLNPQDLKTIYAKGDSMEPRIYCGDSITIDTSSTSVTNDKFYVIRIEDEIFVKKLRKRPGGGLEVISLNPNYETMTLSMDEANHVQVIGRVIHISSMGGL
ncbi:MAG: hypothetical protein DSZ27_08525 [Thiomicrospira sp.]|nr:MAG: hypothetical protein DSZ27_08525 [Thiomicrospira sp.]